MPRILIAGLGSIGRRHLRNLLALGESDILLYRTHQSTLAGDELVSLPTFNDLQAALAQGPEAVIVANPTALHLEVAIPAAEAGCHLFLEKPVSHSLQGIAELEAATQRSGSRVLVGFQFRYHPGLRKLAGLLGEGAIGRPLSLRAHWGEYLPSWHPWEDYRQGYSARADLGGGVTLTLCHPLDYLRWLCGEVEAVWAFTGKLGDLELEVEDTAEIGLRFSSGVLGSVHLDYNQRPVDHHLEVTGTAGTLRWDNADGSITLTGFANGVSEHHTYALPETKPGQPFERNDLFRSEMQHFLNVIAGREQPLCSLQDGLEAQRLVAAVQQAAASRRQVQIDAIP